MNFNKNLETAMEHLHKRGAFLTVKSGDKSNTMTISWGSVGFMWKKPVFMALVRPSRYTYDFIENSDSFTVSIPYDDNMKKALTICGTKSGRDIDKCAEANIEFISSKEVSSPVVDDCNMYYECKILYKQEMDPSLILDDSVEECYKGDNYHTLYYGEIVACYEK